MAIQKCPVCGWEIKDKGKEVKVKDKTVVVCCDDCVKEVKKSPAKYATAS
ncbi:MAG TPA: TRASH domain-containing protein [Gemmataceae bacterium]|nr:TRASH domain-containing protein [Gemmataceae bacterium]